METKYDLYEHQPEECRRALLPRELSEDTPEYIRRIITFNPTSVYETLRYKLNPFNRYNWQNIQFADLFPPRKDKLCPCGCGREVKGSDSWATPDCQFFVIGVWNIIGYRQEFLAEVFKWYYGDDKCHNCHTRKINEWDHIYPVSSGGGGSWLPNHQGLCKKCHTEKTRSDFGWQKLKSSKNYD